MTFFKKKSTGEVSVCPFPLQRGKGTTIFQVLTYIKCCINIQETIETVVLITILKGLNFNKPKNRLRKELTGMIRKYQKAIIPNFMATIV